MGKRKTANSKQTSNSGAPSSSSSQSPNPSTSTFPQTLLQNNFKSLKKHFNTETVVDTRVQTLVPSAVFLQRNFLTSTECRAFIDYAENTLHFESLNSPQTNEYAQRQCGRIQRNDWNIARLLYQRMTMLPNSILNVISDQMNVSHYDPTYKPIDCNGNIRIYKYEKHMSFGKHYDGSNDIKEYPNGRTEVTVLIYLSSCEGGATRFYLPHCAGSSKKSSNGGQNRKKKKKKGNNNSGNNNDNVVDNSNNNNGDDDGSVAFVPEAGSILMHMHGDSCLLHEADPVVDGIKYVLRTDIVFATNS